MWGRRCCCLLLLFLFEFELVFLCGLNDFIMRLYGVGRPLGWSLVVIDSFLNSNSDQRGLGGCLSI